MCVLKLIQLTSLNQADPGLTAEQGLSAQQTAVINLTGVRGFMSPQPAGTDSCTGHMRFISLPLLSLLFKYISSPDISNRL